jgi:hypothetical protein
MVGERVYRLVSTLVGLHLHIESEGDPFELQWQNGTRRTALPYDVRGSRDIEQRFRSEPYGAACPCKAVNLRKDVADNIRDGENRMPAPIVTGPSCAIFSGPISCEQISPVTNAMVVAS